MSNLSKSIIKAVKKNTNVATFSCTLPAARELYNEFPEIKGQYRIFADAVAEQNKLLTVKKVCKKHKISVREYKRVATVISKALHIYQTGHSMGSELSLRVNGAALLSDKPFIPKHLISFWTASHGHLTLSLNKKELLELSFNMKTKRLETKGHYYLVKGGKSVATIAKIKKQ